MPRRRTETCRLELTRVSGTAITTRSRVKLQETLVYSLPSISSHGVDNFMKPDLRHVDRAKLPNVPLKQASPLTMPKFRSPHVNCRVLKSYPEED